MGYMSAVEAGYRSELAELRRELQREIGCIDAKLEQRTAEIRQEIAELRGELRAEFHKDIGSVKVELMKWSFLALWVLIALGVIGLYFRG